MKKLFASAAIAATLAVAQPAAAGYAPVAIPATANPTSTMTRPANTTPYATGQLVASSTTAGSVVVSSFTATASATCSFDLAVVKLSWNNTGTGVGTGLDGWALIVRTFTSAPTYVNGDGGTYRVATNGDTQVGQYTCTLQQYDTAAVALCPSSPGWPSSVKLTSGSTIYWDMQSQGAITPQSGKVATLTPFLKQDVC